MKQSKNKYIPENPTVIIYDPVDIALEQERIDSYKPIKIGETGLGHSRSIFAGIGAKIKTARKKAKLTQKQLAKTIGVSHEWICKIEKDKATSVSMNMIEKIGDALNMNMKMVVIDDLQAYVEGKTSQIKKIKPKTKSK